MEKTWNNKAWFMVLPVLVLVAFSAIIPLMTVVNYSVQDTFGNNQFFWVGLEWFEDLLHSSRFWEALARNLVFSAIILAIQVPLGISGLVLSEAIRSYLQLGVQAGMGSWGNMIDAPEAFARMGADVMRWQYSAQPPTQNLLFGFGPGVEIQRKLLTLWNSVSFFIQYANIADFTPERAEAASFTISNCG